MSIKIFKVDDNNKIGYCLEYYPYKNGENPKFDAASKLILDVKEYNKDSDLTYLFRLIKNDLNGLIGEIKNNFSTFTICTVPSHKVTNQISSTQKLAKLIARYYNIKDGTDYLIRYKDIKKLASGNDRSKKIHYKSIMINDKVNVKNETILLIDDIATTGNSLIACNDILKEKGAKTVILFAIYKTTN